MRIAIFDDFQRAFPSLAVARRLGSHEVVSFADVVRGPEEIAARLEGFDAVVLTQQRTAFARDVVEALPASVKLIIQTGRSAAHLDLDACSARGIRVALGGQGDPSAPAELTWALILGARRGLVTEANALREGHWQTTLGLGLAGQTLGVWGFGRIGTRVAEVGRAFGMRVLCFGREGTATRARAAGFEVADSREALLRESDVLTLHLPFGKDTKHLLTLELLRLMKRDALLVNTSRAGLLAPGALEAGLDAGTPAFAALDVFDEEPLPDDSPWRRRANVLATPHLGFVTRQVLERYYSDALDAAGL
ncbi:MAG: D-2-hydroxyacid dehydrogenase family protein [Myxococcota bacterium]